MAAVKRQQRRAYLSECVAEIMAFAPTEGQGIYDEVNQRLKDRFVPVHAGQVLTVLGGDSNPETGEARNITGRFISCSFWLCGAKKDRTDLRIILLMSDKTERVIFTNKEDDLVWGGK